MITRTTLFLLLLVSQSVLPAEPLVLANANIIDPSAGEPEFEASIVIEDGKIMDVGSVDIDALPDGARIVDVTGKYVIPGLIDTHNHLHFGHDDALWEPDRVLNFLPLWGVTAVFDTAIPMEDFERLRAEEDSARTRARFFSAGRSFGAKDGWGGTLNGGYTPATEEEARAAVRELASTGVDGVKLVYDDMSVFGQGPWPLLDPVLMAAIIDEAHQHELAAYVHAPMLENAKAALRAGADVLIHGIISDPVDEEFLALMRDNNAVYAPTHILYEQGANKPAMSQRYEALDSRSLINRSIYASMWDSRRQNPTTGAKLPILRENLRVIVDTGIPVAMGSDTGVPGVLAGVASQMELVLYVETAMQPIDALRAATSAAAAAIGQQNNLGKVEPGMFADLVILEESPLTDIRNIQTIWAVIINGEFAVAPFPIQ